MLWIWASLFPSVPLKTVWQSIFKLWGKWATFFKHHVNKVSNILYLFFHFISGIDFLFTNGFQQKELYS